MKTPRPYQKAAIDALWDYLLTQNGHPLLVAPVSAGKTLIMSEFIKKVHSVYPRTRILVLTHVKELLQQGAETLMEQYPDSDFGFYCASLGQKRLHNDITFASIQSVHNKIDRFNRCPELILIDECHLISHKNTTTYRKFIDSVLAINPNARVCGLTGTPFRSDTGRLDEGKGRLFDEVCYEIPMSFMIEEGFWTKPFTPKTDFTMDVTGVKTRGGDYIESQLQKAVDVDEVTQECIKGILHHGKERKKGLIFTAGVDHCRHVRDALRACGESAEMVTGETDSLERAAILRDFEKGEFKYLVNVAVLTTGYDCPSIDMLVFMRPMKSPVLYIQCIGRGVRTMYASGYDLSTRDGRLDAIANGIKPNCMVLDFGGVVAELGPIDQVEIRKTYTGEKENEEKGDAILKRCPSCGEMCATSQKYCYSCSYSFIAEQLTSNASQKAVVSIDEEPKEYGVMGVSYFIHKNRTDDTKPTTMRVEYATMAGCFKEWVCFNHQGYARNKAEEWHKERKPNDSYPNSVEQIVEILKDFPAYYPQPLKIIVQKQGKYDRIIGYEFGTKKEDQESNLQEQDFNIPF